MNLNEHALHLGGLLGNFQSLEFVLRGYLSKLPTGEGSALPPGIDIYQSPVGTELPETVFTNYDTLGILISKFNVEMQRQGKVGVETKLIELRDALAHGRVSALGTEELLRIVKFTKPHQGMVKVAFNEMMSSQWLLLQKKRVSEAIHRVAAEIKP